MAPSAQTVHDVMTFNLTTLPMRASVLDAAHAMRDANIGDVLVVDNGHLCGIVTDRDVVIRALAEEYHHKYADTPSLHSVIDRIADDMRQRLLEGV